jgi:hypothetical protein
MGEQRMQPHTSAPQAASVSLATRPSKMLLSASSPLSLKSRVHNDMSPHGSGSRCYRMHGMGSVVVKKGARETKREYACVHGGRAEGWGRVQEHAVKVATCAVCVALRDGWPHPVL